jgi:hypothetical protein
VTLAHEYYFVHFLELISLKPGDKLIVLAFTGKSGFCKLACRAKQIETNKAIVGMSFFSFKTAWRTRAGDMRTRNMLRKGQIRGLEKREIMKRVLFITNLSGVAI